MVSRNYARFLFVDIPVKLASYNGLENERATPFYEWFLKIQFERQRRGSRGESMAGKQYRRKKCLLYSYQGLVEILDAVRSHVLRLPLLRPTKHVRDFAPTPRSIVRHTIETAIIFEWNIDSSSAPAEAITFFESLLIRTNFPTVSLFSEEWTNLNRFLRSFIGSIS